MILEGGMMRVDFVSRDNCHFDPPTLWGPGLGGAEYALVFLAEELARMGHDVTIYSSGARIRYGHVEYRPFSDWEPWASCDLCIIFRVSVPDRPAGAAKVIFFSCDQQTDFGWSRMFPWLDLFVCISENHAGYIATHYNMEPERIAICELGVNIEDYLGDPMEEKIKNRFIFCSVPHRGLHLLLGAWPQVRKIAPDATLVVTSDYTLWGRGTGPNNHEFRAMAARLDGVYFNGKMPRRGLVKEQREAEIMAYPCVYDENF